jgi:hypothetical protein
MTPHGTSPGGDFDPAKLAAMQRDEIEIVVPRELAEAFSYCLYAGVEACNEARYEQNQFDDLFDIAERLENFARTGIDHPDAVYCIACGQPDEPELHDPAKCVAALAQSESE